MAMIDRFAFYKKKRVDGKVEPDFLSSRLPEYVPKRFKRFRIKQFCEGRADLISQIHYDTPDLFWLILHANDIIDPWEELLTGRVIIIPSLNEYYNFYNANARSEQIES